MTEQRIVLETAALDAVDTATELVGFFGELPPLQIPGGVTRLKRIRVSLGTDGGALGAAVYGLRIISTGLEGSPHDFIIGGSGGELIIGDPVALAPWVMEVDIRATPARAFTVNAYMNLDTGINAVGVELIFE